MAYDESEMKTLNGHILTIRMDKSIGQKKALMNQKKGLGKIITTEALKQRWYTT